MHTSYNEILKISPRERSNLVTIISNDIKKQNEQLENQIAKASKR